MIGYIIVFFVCVVPGLVNRIQEAVEQQSIFALFLIECIFTSSQGWLNSLVYGFRESVRKEFSLCFGYDKNENKHLVQVY